MTGSISSEADRGRQGGKVEKLIDQYGIEGLGDELVDRWTAEGDERMSLRDLADYFNIRLIEVVLGREMLGTVEGEAENYYRLLTDDDVSSGSRLDAEHRLESAGIEIDRLESDFVSHQAIHSYLTRDREASYEAAETDPEERIESSFASINRLRNRLAAVTERMVSSLGDAHLLEATEVRASVHLEVECAECDSRYPIREFFESRGCDCDPRSDVE